jgi:hypothetical protein
MNILIDNIRVLTPTSLQDIRGQYVNALAVRIDQPTDDTLSILRALNGVDFVSRLSWNNFLVIPFAGIDLNLIDIAIRAALILYS